LAKFSHIAYKLEVDDCAALEVYFDFGDYYRDSDYSKGKLSQLIQREEEIEFDEDDFMDALDEEKEEKAGPRSNKN
jgi:hypothetical protein